MPFKLRKIKITMNNRRINEPKNRKTEQQDIRMTKKIEGMKH